MQTIEQAIVDSGRTGSIQQVIDETYTTSEGFPAYYSQQQLEFAESLSVDELRQLIFDAVATIETTAEAAEALTRSITSEMRAITVDGTEFTLTLGVIERIANSVLVVNLSRSEDFAAAELVLGDLFRGLTAASAAAVPTTATDDFVQTGNRAADILWVIDSSGSMSEEQANLATGAEAFFDLLAAASIDYHLGVVRMGDDAISDNCWELSPLTDGSRWISPTTSNARGEWSDGISSPGSSGSSTETGLFCGAFGFSSSVTVNAGFNRSDAVDLVIFVSDEAEGEVIKNDTPDSASAAPADTLLNAGSSYVRNTLSNYEQYYQTNNITAFSIVGVGTPADPRADCSGDGGDADGGSAYAAISTLTGGGRASICAPSNTWQTMLESVAERASGLSSQFILANVAIPGSVTVTLNGAAIVRDTSHTEGFDLFNDINGTRVVFYGASIPQDGDAVRISYTFLQ